MAAEMKPGRELDRLVAEAMGWTEVRASGVYIGYIGIHPKGENYVVPFFSVDMNQAMVAFGWLEKNKPWFWVSLQRDNEGVPAVYRHGPNGDRREIASGESYPHAICLAILAAKEEANK